MYELNEKIKDLIPYEPISGTYKIRLDANESYLRIPEYVMAESAAKLIKAQMNRYPDSTAAMLCKAFAVTYGVEVENVVAGNGSDELISLIFNGFLMRGERFATMSPDFSMYDFYGALSEGEKLTISKNPDFTISPEQVILACNSEKVRLLIFSNPCNPTSLGLVAEDVRRIIRGVPDTLVVVDEAYMDFWDQSLLPESANYDNLLILKTCSKAFGLAALRIGFAVGNPTLIR
ncbi:MAG: aminotransferase class I/II-fold pyridoxal phosphate-dependent enzyme, partial [Oscillospiraceae bacterium]